MTTSYELSQRLKDNGYPQEGGEYYYNIAFKTLLHKSELSGQTDYSNLCRAFTLGECVRELPNYVEFSKIDKLYFANTEYKNIITKSDTPEEAAGELMCAVKQTKE